MTALIREARPEEHTEVARVLVEAYTGLVGDSYLPQVRDTGERAGAPATHVLVAVDETTGTVLGTATLALPGSRWSDVGGSREAGLRMLAVRPSARGRGVGAALVAECAARARLAGSTGVALLANDPMADARRLYEHLGFVRQPVRDLVGRSGDVLRAYVLPLPPAPRIRTATPEEYDAVGDLTVAAYVGDGLIEVDHGYVSNLRDAKRRAAEARLIVAVDRATDALLGTATYCSPGSPMGEIAGPDEGEFRMLAVSPAARGRGVGEALVRTVLAEAGRERLRGVAMSSAPAMTSAHRLYERLGFRRATDRDWEPLPGMRLQAFAREI